jgi:hypothetical protein
MSKRWKLVTRSGSWADGGIGWTSSLLGGVLGGVGNGREKEGRSFIGGKRWRDRLLSSFPLPLFRMRRYGATYGSIT